MNDFDSLHLANDTINQYFITDYGVSLDSFLIVNDNRLFRGWGQTRIEDELNFQLCLTERPILDSIFQVKVNIELDNGAVYSTESDAIFIQ